MFITAHKDLRWGGESNPFFPVLGGEPGPWYACQSGQQTSWDYWASWLWASFDNGTTWATEMDSNLLQGTHLLQIILQEDLNA